MLCVEVRCRRSKRWTALNRPQIGHDSTRYAFYVGFWVRALKDDPHEIYRASRDVQDMGDYLLERGLGVGLTADCVGAGSLESVTELTDAIPAYLTERNKNPRPSKSTASGMEILEKIHIARQPRGREYALRQPGEWGVLLGSDRCPEVKCFRRKLAELSADAPALLAWQTTVTGSSSADPGEEV